MANTVTTAPAVPALTNFGAQVRASWLIHSVCLFIVVVLILPVGLVAIGSGSGLIALPYEMFELAGRAPVLFPAHMLASALALLLAPAVVMVRHRPKLHRPLGRLLGGFVVIGGLTALPVAVMSHSPALARAGFFVQGLIWLFLLGAAVAAVRTQDIRRHARLMLAMVAVTTGAIWFRIMTGMAIALSLPFEPVYVLSAWLGWMVPLAFVLLSPRFTSTMLAR
jgi:hypothetical protein